MPFSSEQDNVQSMCGIYLKRLIITAVPARRVTQQTLRISMAGDRFPPNHRVVSAQVLGVS